MTGHNLKEIKKKFKANGVFYTPEALALTLKSYLPDNVTEVYDPTCGAGSLLCVFSDNVKKYGQELDTQQLEEAKKSLVNFTGVAGDTLVNPAFLNRKFDCILANPPFSINWNPVNDVRFEACRVLPPKSKADYAFLLHTIHLLSETGTAVILNFLGKIGRAHV